MSSVAFAPRIAVLQDSLTDSSSTPTHNRFRHAESPLWTKTIWTDTVSLANASGWLVGTLHRLHGLASLPDNWNSYGAVAPNATAIDHAQNVLQQLSDLDFEPSRIDPSAENGVCLSFRAGNRYADIECFNSGDVLAVTSDGSGQPQIWEIIAASRDDLRMAIARIRAFVRS